MKSFSIKTNSNHKKDFIIEELEKIDLNELYISYCEFRIYKNIIVHYSGNDLIKFQKELSSVIAKTIEKFYDEEILFRLIRKNYFYLTEGEQETIERISFKILSASKENENYGEEILKELIYEYVEENKKMILDGFVNFRIKEYIETLDYIAELAVTSYLNLI